MARPFPLTDKERADLIAYLDGELHGEARRNIEAKINLFPEVRAEAESLKRAWDLLDFIPKPPAPSPSFTEQTISRLGTMRFAKKASSARTNWRQRARVLAWLAAVVLAFFAGWWAYSRFVPWAPGEQELVEDLRIIENLRLYQQADSIDFVKKLDRPELFGEEP